MFFTCEEKKQSAEIAARIADLPTKLDGAALFGAGAIGKSLLWHFRRAGLRVAHFVDNQAALRRRTLDGVPIVSLADHMESLAVEKPLVLALAKGMREVREQCLRAGVCNLEPHYLVRAAFGLVPFGARMTAAEIDSEPAAGKGLEAWEDDASREKYRRLVRFQALFDDSRLPTAESGHYFSGNYIPPRFLRAVVDAGACDGDTLREFLTATEGDFDAYYAFEPDPENYRRLTVAIPAGDRRIRTFNMGLGDKTETLRLRGFGSLLSNIGEDGDVEIHVDRLDDVLGDASITLVKMDVEGHEPEALAGMVKTLRRCRPALAVSNYHKVNHLWELPLWIRDLDLGYRCRLGCHGDMYSEAVCYAVPE